MTYLILLASAIIFVELFLGFKIIKDTNAVIKLSSKLIETIKSNAMTDREKEDFMRENSLIMLLITLKFIAKFMTIFSIIYLVVKIILTFFPHLTSSVITGFTSLVPMAILTLVMLLYVWGRDVISSKL